MELRPLQLHEMIGQREVRDRLAISINAALDRGEPLHHVLIDGPPGLGKTTLAKCIGAALGQPVQTANAASITSARELFPILTQAGGGVVFIDEIHRLPMVAEEFLYPAMEDYRLDLVVGEGISAKVMNLKIEPFTLIGATTRAGLLSAPLRDRFRMRERLDFYHVDELADLIAMNARKLGMDLPPGGAERIALSSRGTPRIAINRLLWVRDYGVTTRQDLDDALAKIGVDSHGMDPQDRRYLETLRKFGGGPVGVSAIAQTMCVDEATVTNEIEPYLMRQQLITRTPRGRKLIEA